MNHYTFYNSQDFIDKLKTILYNYPLESVNSKNEVQDGKLVVETTKREKKELRYMYDETGA